MTQFENGKEIPSMELGISTACFYPMLTEEAFRLCGRLGVRTSEIFFNSPAELSGPVFDEVLAIQKEYGVHVASLHPFGSFGEPYYYFSAYERRCYDTLDDYRRNAHAAARLGASYVVMHGGRPSTIPDEVYWERFRLIQSVCRQEGAELAHENVVHYRLESPEFVKRMRCAMHDDVAFVLDIKQAVRAGTDPFAMLDAMGPCIKHVHLNDHTPEQSCLPPGRGSFDFAALFSSLQAQGFDGAGVIEVYRGDFGEPEELMDSLDFLRRSVAVAMERK